MKAFQLSLFVYFLFCLITATSGNDAVHEKRSTTPGVQRLSRMQGNSTIPIKVTLAQQNLEHAEEYLLSVSDPKSSEYAHYWTAEAVALKFSPSVQTFEQVQDWLPTSGIARKRLRGSRRKGGINFDATVREAEQLFNTTYYLYETQGTGATFVGCDEYRLPASLQEHIDFITPTIQLGNKIRRHQVSKNKETHFKSRMLSPISQHTQAVNSKPQITPLSQTSRFPKRKSPFLLSDCSQSMTPDCLRALYHIPHGNVSHPNNSLGVVQFDWSSYRPKDLNMFFERFEPSMVNNTPIFKSIDGGTLQNISESDAFNREPALDLEYTMSLTFPLDVTNYQVGDLQSREEPSGMNNLLAAFDAFYSSALDPQYDAIYPHNIPASDGIPAGYNHSDYGTLRPSHVISVSYGDDESSLTPAYERRQCFGYLKLGLQGITMIFAAGDYGTAGITDTCVDPSTGSPAQPGVSGNYQATFPASCPYITSVGGTEMATNSSTQDRKVAWQTTLRMKGEDPSGMSNVTQVISSGGGFSNVFTAPGYQCHAVESYLEQEQPSLMNISSLFKPNLDGLLARGYPDVAVNANAYYTVVDGNETTIYGTSGSAPVFASIIAKINDRRLRGGKKPVGFLNPALYANPQVLNDIVSGRNYDCVGQSAFHATTGWDPVTGLGTPDFDLMLELFMGFP